MNHAILTCSLLLILFELTLACFAAFCYFKMRSIESEEYNMTELALSYKKKSITAKYAIFTMFLLFIVTISIGCFTISF